MNGGTNGGKGGGVGGGMGGVGKTPLYPGQGRAMQGGYNGGVPTPDYLMPSCMGGAESSGGASGIPTNASASASARSGLMTVPSSRSAAPR